MAKYVLTYTKIEGLTPEQLQQFEVAAAAKDFTFCGKWDDDDIIGFGIPEINPDPKLNNMQVDYFHLSAKGTEEHYEAYIEVTFEELMEGIGELGDD